MLPKLTRALALSVVGSLAAWACASPPAVHAPPIPAKASASAPAAAPLDPEAFRNVPPKPGAAAPVVFPAPELKTLKNGVTLYVVPKHSAVATLSVVVRHGAMSVPIGKSGLAALTARMLTEGTRKRTSLGLAEASESLGSTLEADAGRDESHVSIATLTNDTTRGLELLAEVVFTPAFSAKEFERVKGEWLDGLRAERQEPSRLATLVALRSLLGPAGGAPVSGSIPDVSKLKTSDLVEFHHKAYVPANLAVIVVGDLNLAKLEPDVERLFGRANGPAYPAPADALNPEKPAKTQFVIVDRKGSVQTTIFAVQPFPRRSQPGFEAREIMGTLLGGLFTSRLNLNLRDKDAYTYGVHGQAIATRQWGAFFVATDVKTETTADSVVELLAELERARDPKRGAPIQDAEAARARTDLMHALGARLEHTSQIADSMRSAFTQGLAPDYYAKYPELVAQIPTSEVARQAELLDPQHLLVVLVGDRAQIEPSMKARGFELTSVDPKLLE